MDGFMERLVNEKIELDERREKLDSFLNSDKVKGVDTLQKSLLIVQCSIMSSYSKILTERISLLTKVNAE